ncbi:MAG: thioredoxin family protein [Paracoccaceae bacterium]
MDRRNFIGLGAVSLAIPSWLQAAGAGFEAYRPGMIAAYLAAGEVVFVDYHATWCSTCRTQSRVIEQLTDANPAYAAAMKFVRVDWDEYRRHAVTTSRNIPRRSTLLVLKGDAELGRLVAQTRANDIRALLDAGLAATA